MWAWASSQSNWIEYNHKFNFAYDAQTCCVGRLLNRLLDTATVNADQVWLTLWFGQRTVGLIYRWQPVLSIETVRQQRRSLTVSHVVNEHKSAKKSTLWMFAAGKCSHEEQKWSVKVKLQASHNHMISATRKSTTKITTQARDRGFGQLATSSQGLKNLYNPVLISSHSFRCAVLQVKY